VFPPCQTTNQLVHSVPGCGHVSQSKFFILKNPYDSHLAHMKRRITGLLWTSKRKKTVSLRGASPPDPPPGALPSGPRWGLRPQTPVIRSRSRARHARGSSAPKRHTLSSPLQIPCKFSKFNAEFSNM